MSKNKAILEPEYIYHIYNRAVGNELMYRNEEDYRNFLYKYQLHISPIVETYAYCLLPNHFHLIIRFKPEEELEDYFKLKYPTFEVANLKGWDKKLIQQFSNFFNAYSKHINTKYDRMGSLFMNSFKRKLALDPAYKSALIAYIHTNPIHHKLAKKLEDWQYSSYCAYLYEGKKSKVATEDMLYHFGGKQALIDFHQHYKSNKLYLNFNL